MSCCGKSRSQLRTPRQGADNRVYIAKPQPPKATFIYVGSGTGMTVKGPVSGIQYNFPGAGVKVEVGGRDRAMLANLRLLRQVK